MSGFFGSLMGGDQNKTVQKAGEDAWHQVDTGAQLAKGQIQTGMDQAQGYYKPYAQQGQQAQTMYGNALGMNGAGAQQQFQQGYGGDPFRKQNEDYTTNALMRSYNARGMGGGGTAAMAAARANLQRGSQDYNQYLDRLSGQAGMGAQMAGAQAGAAQNGYNALGSLEWSRGNTMAANTINLANAKAKNSQGGINNLIGLGGLGAEAFGSEGALSGLGGALSGAGSWLGGLFSGGEGAGAAAALLAL